MKVLKMILIAIVLTVGYLVMSFDAATVEERSINTKQVRFNLEPGDRIYVIDKTATYCRLNRKPTESLKYYYKVPEGKTLKGILNLK